MDLGSGIGRASVCMATYYGWRDSKYYLIDGDSGNRQVCGTSQRHGEYYNSHAVAYEFCRANGLYKVLCVDPNDVSRDVIPEQIDVVVSWLSVGFHWPMKFYLMNIRCFLKPGCLLFFGTRNCDRMGWVQNEISSIPVDMYRLLEVHVQKPKTWGSMIILEAK